MLSWARWKRQVNFLSKYMWLILKLTAHLSQFCAQQQLHAPGKRDVIRFKQNPVQMMQVVIICRYMSFESTWKIKHTFRMLFFFLCIRIYVFKLAAYGNQLTNIQYLNNVHLRISRQYMCEYRRIYCSTNSDDATSGNCKIYRQLSKHVWNIHEV